MIKNLDQPMPAEQVGWKFARLKTMYDHGINVPTFFCLTGEFFADAVPATVGRVSCDVDFDDWNAVQAASARIRRDIVDRGLGPAAEHLLAQALETTFEPQALVAVRASVLSDRIDDGEDSAHHAFAGMSDSYLYVPLGRVGTAVRQCWASAFNAEALLYRHRQGLATENLRVAVGVQEMIFGERSVVLFTCDPTNYAQDTVIAAGWGIGEGVVAERTQTDHYFVRARTTAVDRAIAHKTTMVTFDADRGYGTREVPVPEEQRSEPVLTDDELRALNDLGAKIERIFGCPQDIEATITSDATVHVLQSRPITLDPDRARVFSSANISESFPGTTTPMTYSVARRFYWLLNHDYLRRCGVPERDLHDKHETMTRLVAYIDGRIYHNITSFIRMLAVLPLFDGVRADWERLVAELDTNYHYPDHVPPSVGVRVRRTVRLIASEARAGRNYVLLRREFAEFERRWAEIMRARRGGFAGKHPLTLVEDFRYVWRQAAQLWGITLINYQFMLLTHRQIERWFAAWSVDGAEALFSQLLCGGRQLRGAEIALSAVRLAELARADPALRELFLGESAESIWKKLVSGELSPEFSAAVEAHLASHGDRGLDELELEKPNLREQPWELLRLVGQYAERGTTAADMEECELRTRRAGDRQLAEALPSILRRKVVLALFSQLRTFLQYRETGRYMRSELFGYSRKVISELGAVLHQRGVLADADDVFLLELDELFGFLDGSGTTHDLAGLVEIRRKDRARARRRLPLREFSTADVVAMSVPQVVERFDEEGERGDRLLQGLGSCPGVVRGRARVVLEPSFDGTLESGDILVARETDPGWLYLMLAVSGIVVERGSLLSHTAITGRKFGIPTIVSVPGAVSRIPDGAMVELDGTTGTVKVERP